MLFITVANFFAKYAQPRWSSHLPVRLACRCVYRTMIETPANIGALRRRMFYHDGGPANAQHDTYPYRDRRFAPWPEDYDSEHYCVVTDRQRGIIRRGVSYVLWKYHEATGRYIKLFPGGGHENDAKNWHVILEDLNQIHQISGDFRDHLRDTRKRTASVGRYIGVSPSEGDYGQLYWFEGIDNDGRIYISTYFNFEHAFVELLPVELDANYITWYKI